MDGQSCTISEVEFGLCAPVNDLDQESMAFIMSKGGEDILSRDNDTLMLHMKSESQASQLPVPQKKNYNSVQSTGEKDKSARVSMPMKQAIDHNQIDFAGAEEDSINGSELYPSEDNKHMQT